MRTQTFGVEIVMTSITRHQAEQVEMVTPILHYDETEMLQELIRLFRKAGAMINASCDIHISHRIPIQRSW